MDHSGFGRHVGATGASLATDWDLCTGWIGALTFYSVDERHSGAGSGVREIVLVTPPQRGRDHPADVILAAATIAGVSEVYVLGGAQAIAALAYGTESIPRVDKIVGPGNLFVTLAKQQVFGVVGIDGLAGPTETVVIADDTANPEWVAADLLAQAEHDVLAAAILLTPSETLARRVQQEVAAQAAQLPRQDILALSLVGRSGIVLTRDLEEAVALSNAYAPST